mmetsp:Transcript_13214/g.31365  ORF Transcript_13214/g.31365 Transcript_13214/m.31365 type:complete len:140 (+) Transcript_13214:37-456(+)
MANSARYAEVFGAELKQGADGQRLLSASEEAQRRSMYQLRSLEQTYTHGIEPNQASLPSAHPDAGKQPMTHADLQIQVNLLQRLLKTEQRSHQEERARRFAAEKRELEQQFRAEVAEVQLQQQLSLCRGVLLKLRVCPG